eukprot:8368882-Pyramimonas_sp.AAC.1
MRLPDANSLQVAASSFKGRKRNLSLRRSVTPFPPGAFTTPLHADSAFYALGAPVGGPAVPFTFALSSAASTHVPSTP